MKVLFISPSFYPATYYGGPTFLNRDLCETLSASGVELQVLTTDSDGPRRRIDLNDSFLREPDYEITYCRRMFRPDIAPGLLLRLAKMIRRADVVHLNGVYSFTTLPTLALCRLLRTPVVWSTLGAFQRWRGNRRETIKRVFERLCATFCEDDRVVLHASSETENYENGRMKKALRIAIPYGVQIPDLVSGMAAKGDALRLLYLGRLHPIKGLENLLRAMTFTRTNVTLAICGQGDAVYERLLRSLVSELNLGERVQFRGVVKDESKEKQFREADICVVPSFKESFGAVVTESLAHAVPVIVSHGAPWEDLEKIGCGLWVSNEPAELAKAVDRAAGMSLIEMGMRGREWMKREFSWNQSATTVIQTYRALIDDQSCEELKIIAPKPA